jgi:hypothetical protein
VKQRTSVEDIPTGPKDAKSTVRSLEQEAIIVTFRQHTLLPLDDCLYALQETIPELTRSSLPGACNATASVGCQWSMRTSQSARSSRLIRSATSISIWQKCALNRASSTCSSPLIAHQRLS